MKNKLIGIIISISFAIFSLNASGRIIPEEDSTSAFPDTLLKIDANTPVSGYLSINKSIGISIENETQLIDYVFDIDLLKTTFEITQPYKDSITNKYKALYDSLIVNLDSAKHLKLKNELERRCKSERSGIDAYDLVVEIDSVSFEFFNGNIKNIVAPGKLTMEFPYEGETVREDLVTGMVFQNSNPIPFSTLHDFSSLDRLYMYYQKAFGIKFPVGELILYNPNLELNSEDYSPMNLSVDIELQKEVSTSVLYKEESVNILQAKIFTDFMGLGAENPNGMLQTEVSKRFILYPKKVPREIRPGRLVNRSDNILRKMFKNNPDGVIDTDNKEFKKAKILKHKSYFVKSGKQYNRILTFGFLNYFEPVFKFSKLEKNNKYLSLQYEEDYAEKYVTPIDLYSHANMSFGGRLNGLVIDFPILKSSVYFNIGAYYQLVGIKDSTAVEKDDVVVVTNDLYNVGMMQTFFETQWNIKSDSRYTIALFYRYIGLDLLTDKFKMERVNLTQQTKVLNRENRMHNVQLLASIRPFKNNNGQLFFRGTVTFEKDNSNNNYFQAQVGYSFNVFQKK